MDSDPTSRYAGHVSVHLQKIITAYNRDLTISNACVAHQGFEVGQPLRIKRVRGWMSEGVIQAVKSHHWNTNARKRAYSIAFSTGCT